MNLSAWVLSIVGIVVLTLMVDIIIPEGKTGKYIKGVFAMLTVFVIAMPLPKIFNSEFDLEEFCSKTHRRRQITMCLKIYIICGWKGWNKK